MKGNYCYYCERRFGSIPINGVEPLKRTVDHVFPVKLGGTWHQDNIVSACNKCNGLKGHKTISEFSRFLTEWIDAGYQTRNGYTLSNLIIIRHNANKLIKQERKYRELLNRITSAKSRLVTAAVSDTTEAK